MAIAPEERARRTPARSPDGTHGAGRLRGLWSRSRPLRDRGGEAEHEPHFDIAQVDDDDDLPHDAPHSNFVMIQPSTSIADWVTRSPIVGSSLPGERYRRPRRSRRARWGSSRVRNAS